MKEMLFNLYYFATNDLVTHVAMVEYSYEGTEDEKRRFLLSKVGTDLTIAQYDDIPLVLSDRDHGISIQRVNTLMRTGSIDHIFSNLLTKVNFNDSSLRLITPIHNGKITYVYRLDDEPLRQKHIDEILGYKLSNHNDYLEKYYSGNTFDVGQLLKDDHLIPIHLLFNQKHYLSCTKLLLSFIDTIAWIDIGEHHNFTKWIDLYADLSKIGVTSAEIWELRNSLLHMSNLDSQKVKQGKVRRVSFAISNKDSFNTVTVGDTTYFSLIDFLYIVEDAMRKWVDTYNSDNLKTITFIERYDKIVRNS